MNVIVKMSMLPPAEAPAALKTKKWSIQTLKIHKVSFVILIKTLVCKEILNLAKLISNFSVDPGIPQPVFSTPQVPGPSHLALPLYPSLTNMTCAVCPLVLGLNPEVPYRALGTVELVRILLNGERGETNMPLLTGQHVICDPCFFNKMQHFTEGWRILNLQLNYQLVSYEN